MSELKSSTIYNGIDIFKLIASILIIFLHATDPTDHYATAFMIIFTRFAVPFFFISSGFFLHKGLSRTDNSRQYFKKYLKNLLVSFLVWAIIIYSPFIITSYIKNNPSISLLKIVLLVFRRIFIIGPGPYWYLLVLLISAVFICFCHINKKDSLLTFVMILGFSLQIAYVCFSGVLSKIFIFDLLFKGIYFVFSWEFNFIMYGIPFMGIGYFFSKKNIHLKPSASAVIFIFATLFKYFEYIIPEIFPSEFWNGNEIFVAYGLQAISFFLLAKAITFNISKKTSLFLRQLSSFIYFSHAILLYNILDPILYKFTNWQQHLYATTLPKTLIILFTCVLLFILIKRINNKYLNLLLNA